MALVYSVNETISAKTGVDILKELPVKQACESARWVIWTKDPSGVDIVLGINPKPKSSCPKDAPFRERLFSGTSKDVEKLLPPRKGFQVKAYVSAPSAPPRVSVGYQWVH